MGAHELRADQHGSSDQRCENIMLVLITRAINLFASRPAIEQLAIERRATGGGSDGLTLSPTQARSSDCAIGNYPARHHLGHIDRLNGRENKVFAPARSDRVPHAKQARQRQRREPCRWSCSMRSQRLCFQHPQRDPTSVWNTRIGQLGCGGRSAIDRAIKIFKDNPYALAKTPILEDLEQLKQSDRTKE
jgi:hypothetical protein